MSMNRQPKKVQVNLVRLEDYGLEVPCYKACPVNTGAGAYVREIAEGNYQEGYLKAVQPNPMASVCARICAAPCEDDCRRTIVDEPVTIRALKRFVCEKYENTQVREKTQSSNRHFNQPGKKVAVIGGGPAGITCSHVLADFGYRVTIFEAAERLGGALWKFIPAYRLPRSVLDQELESLTDKNVDVLLENGLNHSTNIDFLSRQGYQAFFLACGADRSLDLAIEGRHALGVYKAIDYLITVNRNMKVELGKKVVVIGGGNTAVNAVHPHSHSIFEDDVGFAASDPGLSGIDAARSAMKNGAESVIIASLEAMADMPAVQTEKGRKEINEAQNEGVKLLEGVGPKKILVENGKVVGVEFLKVERLLDDTGRFAPTFQANSEIRFEADSVIMAIGRVPDLFFLQETDGVELTPEGRLKVDPETLQSSALDIFGGGDSAFEPGVIVDAVAHGKQAAISIHKFLQSGNIREKLVVRIQKLDPENFRKTPGYDVIPRRLPEKTPISERSFTVEVEKNYDEQTALEQAGRCLDCYIQTVYDSELCILCRSCVEICPCRCLHFVEIEQLVSAEKATVKFMGEYQSGGSMGLIKEDETCIRCGLCARVCPSGALTLERLHTSLEAIRTSEIT